ncbi:MAG: acyl carrier protein phosphodiesterase [Flavobacterium sp.]|nr:acyl carrier protein phosphodiesterase [Flavobacterium sp.]
MNFLAHIHLSGENEFIKIGNFMADGVRGKQYDNFPSEIQKGILLHRAIDTFTDAHPLFRQSTKKLHSRYHHYAGVIVDMYYDHFLAKNWSDYHNESLALYSEKFYQSLLDNHSILTSKTQHLLPYMVEYNWLVNYQSVPGLERILSQMDRRTKNQSLMRFATEELVAHYDEFEAEFSLFYKEVQLFSKNKLNEL